MQQKYILLRTLALQTAAMMARSLPTMIGKSLVYDVMDTCATHAGLVHDVKDTDR